METVGGQAIIDEVTVRTVTWSDVDLPVLAGDHAVEAVFETVHAVLELLSPIAHRWRIPSPRGGELFAVTIETTNPRRASPGVRC